MESSRSVKISVNRLNSSRVNIITPSETSKLEDGSSKIEVTHSVSSVSDMLSVGGRRLSGSALPTVFSLGIGAQSHPSLALSPSTSPGRHLPSRSGILSPPSSPSPPIRRHLSSQAIDAHPQPYHEHLWSREILREHYVKSNISLSDVSQSAGLSSEDATKLLEEYGHNVLTPPPRVPHIMLFLLQFCNLFMVLLMIAGILCLILYGVGSGDSNLYIGVLLWVVVIATCYETYYQEATADELMNKFRLLIPQSADAIRNGTRCTMSVENLVPGDIISLCSGQKVPADCRVLYSCDLKVDQSMLTGESEPVELQDSPADIDAISSRCLVFNGSLVVEGNGYALCIRTGDMTLIGKMVELTGTAQVKQSTLKGDIQEFVKFVCIIALCQAVVIFVIGIARGLDPIDVFVNGFIVIIIANGKLCRSQSLSLSLSLSLCLLPTT